MGELLFWVGEDKMTFGSDYAIWEPKWQVEGFVDWEMPGRAEFSDYPRLGRQRARRRSSGSTRPSCTTSRCRPELRAPVPAVGARVPGERRGSPGVSLRFRVLESSGTVYDPELDRADHHPRLRRLLPVSDRGRRRLGAPAAAHAAVRAELRLPDGGRRARAVRRLPEVAAVTVVLEDHYTGAEINAAVGRGDGFATRSRRDRGDLDALRELFQRKALLARQARLCQRCSTAGPPRGRRRAARRDLPTTPTACGRGAARRARPAARPRRAGAVAGDGAR
jgi:hypothetical protein